MQLKNRLDRKRSVDTTSAGSNVTVIESNVPDEVFHEDVKVYPEAEKLITKSNLNSESLPSKQDDVAETLPTKPNDESSRKPPALQSCLLRRDSARASIKKKVRCSEATEVIPIDFFINEDDGHELSHEDDDDVFSDSAPVQAICVRGNMCTPYVDRKGSLPGLEALPDWFPNSRLIIFTQNLLTFFHYSLDRNVVQKLL